MATLQGALDAREAELAGAHKQLEDMQAVTAQVGAAACLPTCLLDACRLPAKGQCGNTALLFDLTSTTLLL
jgi:hypothetical protein